MPRSNVTQSSTPWIVDGVVDVQFPENQSVSVNTLPLPAGAAKDSTLSDGSQRVGGTVAVSGVFFQPTQPVSAVAWPLPAGAASESTLAAVNAKLAGTIAVTGAFYPATQPVSAAALPLPAGAATDATLTNGNLRVGGSVAVTGAFQATQPVSIASMPSTPVTGPLTDAQLRASAVPVVATALGTADVSEPEANTVLDRLARIERAVKDSAPEPPPTTPTRRRQLTHLHGRC